MIEPAFCTTSTGSPSSGTACQAGSARPRAGLAGRPSARSPSSRASAASSISTRAGRVVPSPTGTRTVARSAVHWNVPPSGRCSMPQPPSTTWASRHRSMPSTRTPLTITPSCLGVGTGRVEGRASTARPRRSGRRTPCRPTPRPARRRPRCRPPAAASQPGLDERVGVDQAHEVDAVEVAQRQVVGHEPAVVVVADEADARERSATMRSLPSVEALSTTTRSSRSCGQSSADTRGEAPGQEVAAVPVEDDEAHERRSPGRGALGDGGRGRGDGHRSGMIVPDPVGVKAGAGEA